MSLLFRFFAPLPVHRLIDHRRAGAGFCHPLALRGSWPGVAALLRQAFPVLQRCFFIVVYSLLVAANVCKNIWKDVYLAENDSRKYTISGVSVNHCAKPATFGLAKRVQLPYFLLAPACNMALAAGARQWLPCPLCHARSRFLAVGGRAGVLSGRPPLCCHFSQIVSLFRPAAQPPGCQRVAVWAVLNGKTARFAAPNGRFCGLVRAVWPVRHGMAWAASRRCNYFVPCFRKAAGWLAVI